MSLGVNTSNKWQDELDEIYRKINEREAFSYDQNNDALYKQYAQQYQSNAKLAMEDTVGQVSALTGGYANSYAATAGQAMYNQQMNGLNDKALEIYQAALQQYNMESDRLMGIYSMTASNYGLEQDRIDSEIAQAQWAAEYAESQRQFNAQLAYDKERAAADDARWKAELASEESRYYAGLSAENTRYYQNLSYEKQRDKASDAQFAQDLAYKYAELEYDNAKLAEDQRQFNVKNGVLGTQSTQPTQSTKPKQDTKPIQDTKPKTSNIDEAKMKRLLQGMAGNRTETGWLNELERKQKSGAITAEEAEWLYNYKFGK